MNLWLAWAAAVLAAVALTALVLLVETTTAELDAIEAVRRSPLPGDTLSNLVRAVTHTEQDIIVGALVAGALWRSGARRPAVVFVVLLVVLPFVQHGIKELVDRDRPPYDADLLWSEPASPSFPSGHVMSATVVYGYVLFSALYAPWAQAWRLAAGAVAVAAVLLTAVTSVYLAVHWPTDVAGGYVWGLTLLLPAAGLSKLRPAARREGLSTPSA